MSKIAVTYSEQVGGESVQSLKKSFESVGSAVVDADYRDLMKEFTEKEFNELYETQEGRIKLFAHAKAKATKFFTENKIDCLALSGNSAMIDPVLFNQKRSKGTVYDFSRTIAELGLIHVATQTGMPLLGVCGGHQAVAVYGGGSIASLKPNELEKQKLMDYEEIKTENNTILNSLLGPTPNVFGAHSQIIKSEPEGYKKAASSDQLNEGTEREHGAPAITTQFHPEIAVQGLPVSQSMYQAPVIDYKNSLKIFEFFDKAGDAYRIKLESNEFIKSQHELKQVEEKQVENAHPNKKKSDKTVVRTNTPYRENKKSIFTNKYVLSAVIVALLAVAAIVVPIILASPVFLVGAGTTAASIVVASAIGIAGGFLFNHLKNKVPALLRNIFSNIVTNKKLSELNNKFEESQQVFDKLSQNSTRNIYSELNGKRPQTQLEIKSGNSHHVRKARRSWDTVIAYSVDSKSYFKAPKNILTETEASEGFVSSPK